MTKTVEFRAYSAKSKAVRALNGKGCEPTEDYLKQENNKWGFYVDEEGNALRIKEAIIALCNGAVRDDGDEVKVHEEQPAVKPVEVPKFVENNSAFAAMVNQQLAAPVAAVVPEKRAMQKERPEANGVKRPGDATLCGQIWAFLDANSQPGNPCPVSKAKSEAERQQWDSTTIVVQYYRWRKFNGISGRQGK